MCMRKTDSQYSYQSSAFYVLQDSDVRRNKRDGSFQIAFTKNVPLIAILMHVNKWVAVGKIDFEYRGKSFLLRKFAFFGLWEFWCNDQNPLFVFK